MYLPGIGEAIGGILRVQRQNELWTKAQDILKDETKPMADRLQLVGVAYPELANSEEFQKRVETSRQYDADKMARAKFDREEAAAASAQRFREKLQTLPEEQRRAYMLANPDVAADALPELLKQYQGEAKAAEEDATWNERFQLQEQGKNQRNAATNQATVTAQQLALDKEYRAGVASGAVDPATGQVIPYAQRQSDAQAREVETARLKGEEAAKVAAQVKQQGATKLGNRLINYRDAVVKEGAAGFFNADKEALQSERKLLVNELARQMAGGNAEPNPSMVEDAESMIPAVAAMIDTPELFKAAINAVIKAQGVSPDGNQPPPPPPGFKVIP